MDQANPVATAAPIAEGPNALAEIKAMETIFGALTPLLPDAQARVLKWVQDYFKIASRSSNTQEHQHDSSEDQSSPTPPSAHDLSELFSITSPKTDPERALLAAYWLQVSQNNAEWASGQVQSLLKDMGHQAANITNTMTSLKEREPSLVVQTKKSGNSKQSRKLYKLTKAGIAHVKSLLDLAQ